MTEPPDLDALARRYVDLWQDQMAAAVIDPEVTETLTRLMQLMGRGLAVSGGMWQAMWSETMVRQAASGGFGSGETHGNDGSTPTPGSWAAPTPGAAPAAGASAVGGGDLAQLQARLAAFEERLAAVETEPRVPRRSPRARSRRNDAS